MGNETDARTIRNKIMTDEEITELAEKVKKEKYCDKYNNGCDNFYDIHIHSCEEKQCPLFHGIDGYYDYCIGDNGYDIGFLDGYKAAFDVIIGKTKSL